MQKMQKNDNAARKDWKKKLHSLREKGEKGGNISRKHLKNFRKCLESLEKLSLLPGNESKSGPSGTFRHDGVPVVFGHVPLEFPTQPTTAFTRARAAP